MLTFTIPAPALARLSRLALATEATQTSSTRHIALRITPTACRFSATDGRLLASILHEVTDLVGEPIDVLLDCAQFTTACRLLASYKVRQVAVSVDATEVRFSAGLVSAIVRRHEGVFPPFEHIFSKTDGQRWVPCVSSFHPGLIATAQQIAGKTTLLFSTPVHPESALLRLWASPKPDEMLASSLLTDVQRYIQAPAYWADHELALLVMPIRRSDGEPQLDLGRFSCQSVSAQATAA